MKRDAFIRVLLSLVLLLSQQMAFTHAMSHRTGSTEARATVQYDGSGNPLKAVAHDQGCAKCYVYSQLASALGSSSLIVLDADLASSNDISLLPSPDCSATVVVFQSRAPPQA